MTTTWTVPAVVIAVVDGDTIRGDLDLGWHIWLRSQLIRLDGIDAPELNVPAGQVARTWLRELVTPGMQVTVHSHRLDKYGRPLGAVILPDGRDVATLMVEAGMAVPYSGGRRT